MSIPFTVSSSPHIREGSTTGRIMGDVLIALLPASIAGFIFFGARVLLVIAVTVISAVFWEWSVRKIMKRTDTIFDLSAAVSGLLLALSFTPTIPLWITVVGSFLAVVVIKQLFGGLGQNFMNPALGARAILVVSYGRAMTAWVNPVGVDAVSTATPLALMREAGAELPAIMDMFLGRTGGTIGETSALALLIGFLYLLFRKVITWQIPFLFVGTTATLVWVFGAGGLFSGDPIRHVLAGSLILGACFMATDYSTSPVSKKGKWIYAVGCGLLTAIFRLFTTMPEGVSFAIILMNVVTPLLDRLTVPVSFGGDKHER